MKNLLESIEKLWLAITFAEAGAHSASMEFTKHAAHDVAGANCALFEAR